MPFYTDAYLADTHHLSAEEHGAYLLLILTTWRHNGIPPRDDDRVLARITKIPLRRWKSHVRPQLEPFFHREDGHWRQKRLEATWAEVMEKTARARHAALVRHKGLELPDSAAASASPAQLPSTIHPPSSNVDVKKKNHEKSLQEAAHSSNSAALRLQEQKQEATVKPPSPALDALKPILSDVSYFLAGGKRISPSLRPQLRAAHGELSQLLQPITPQALTQELDRLWRHFPKRPAEIDRHALRADYAAFFSPFPQDLVAASISAAMRARPYASLPPLAELEPKLRPALRLRQKQQERIERLINQTENP